MLTVRDDMTGPRRKDLDGLAALAVLVVVLFHLSPSRLPGGFAGVDVLLVLAGYVAARLWRERAGVGLLPGVVRAVVGAGVVVVGVELAAFVLLDATDARRVARDGAYAVTTLLNARFADHSAGVDPGPGALQHFWPFGVLLQTAVVLVVVVAASTGIRRAAGRRGADRSIATVGVAAAVLGVAAFVAQLATDVRSQAFFATYARAWEPLLGVLVACATSHADRLPAVVVTVARTVGVGAVVAFVAFAPDSPVTHPGVLALVPALGAALVAGSGPVGRRDAVGWALASRPTGVLARYSYGWYLWHWPPLVLLPLRLGHRLSRIELVVVAVVALLGAVLTHTVLGRLGRPGAAAVRTPRRSLAAVAAVVVLAGVASFGVHRVAVPDPVRHITADRGLESLRPTPARARTEQPVPTADGCEVGLRSADLSKDCRYLPDTGHGDIVLVGDSHAVQWFSAVRDAAQRRHWGLRVWTRASCPFADISKMTANGPLRACDNWRRDITARLRAARPSLVVVASLASVVPAVYDRRTHGVLHGRAAAGAYTAGLQRQLETLRAVGSRVLVIRDQPYYAFGAPACVLAHPHRLSACSASRSTTMKASADVPAARAVSGVRLLDLTSTWCNVKRCYQVVGSTLAYRDTNHLTLEMVDRLAPQVADAMYRTYGG